MSAGRCTASSRAVQPEPLSMRNQARRQRVTSDDVARLAGVSKSAVSRTFTRDASVSAKMRQRVLKAADTLGYRPNPIARSLTTKRSAIVGVAMSHMDQLYAPLLTRLSERLTQEGFRLLLFKSSAHDNSDAELERIVQYNVDALILVSVILSDAFADRCHRAHVPVIQINPNNRARPLSTITSDNRAGGRVIAEFLLAGGHRRFAYMAGFEGSYTSDARRLGYYDALKSAGHPAPSCETGEYSFEGGVIAARKLLSGPVCPDAIFCANDSMACATVDVARREFGLAVGSALSIVGFDDEPMAAWPGFGITTYTLPLATLVERTIELMRALWENNDSFADVTVPGELVIRTSARLTPGIR
jgi:DNA-binding LacI/PurR family transcriptional regulator